MWKNIHFKFSLVLQQISFSRTYPPRSVERGGRVQISILLLDRVSQNMIFTRAIFLLFIYRIPHYWKPFILKQSTKKRRVIVHGMCDTNNYHCKTYLHKKTKQNGMHCEITMYCTTLNMEQKKQWTHRRPIIIIKKCTKKK